MNRKRQRWRRGAMAVSLTLGLTVGAGFTAQIEGPVAESAPGDVRLAGEGERTPEPSSGAGTPDREPDQELQRIDELERQIVILTEEFESLRREEGAAPIDDAAGSVPGGVAQAASKVYRGSQGVALGGYGEWIYQNFDRQTEAGSESGRQDTADFLRLVLYAGYKFSNTVLFNSELEFEHASTGEDGEVSVEFAQLDFMFRPEIGLRTGMILVPIGLVNELHEPPTFLGARRPEVETRILPSTWRELGIGVFGEAGAVSYRAYVMTGLDGGGFSADAGIRGGRQKGSKAAAEDLALAGRVDVTAVPGLVAGASAFTGRSGQGAEIGGQTIAAKVTAVDLHADWRWRGLELRGLLANVEIDDAQALSQITGETIGSRSRGWYLSAGFDVLARSGSNGHQLIPFVRFESLDTQDRVPATLVATVTGENDRRVMVYGLAYKPQENIAIKIDYEDQSTAARTGVSQLNLAVGLYF